MPVTLFLYLSSLMKAWPTDGRTDRRTHPLIKMRKRCQWHSFVIFQVLWKRRTDGPTDWWTDVPTDTPSYTDAKTMPVTLHSTPLAHSFARSFICSLVRSFTRSLIHSLAPRTACVDITDSSHIVRGSPDIVDSSHSGNRSPYVIDSSHIARGSPDVINSSQNATTRCFASFESAFLKRARIE